jgi:hypothetical protein
MAVYDLYGFLSDDINGARDILEAAFGFKFDDRDSDYQGGKYFQWGETASEHFILKRNIDHIDGKPVEIPFPEHKILFYVNDTSRSKDLRVRMTQWAANFDLLRHEDLE